MNKIYYNKQFIDSSDIKEVKNSLNQKLITTGPYVKKLEKSLQNYLGTKNAITCSSGTSAIFMALKSVNLKKGDNIIIPAINFIASTNIAELLQANIYLADVDPNTGQMTPQTLMDCIKFNKLKKIKVVITMFLGGGPNNIIEFYQLKKKFKFYLIEDSCHALGAKYFYKKNFLMVGCSKHCDISTFSLHPVKSITSGEGGIVTTNNKALALKIRILRSHGMSRAINPNKANQYWKYDIVMPSLNFRLSDINASLAYSQLKKLNKFINFRNKFYLKYKYEFRNLTNFIKIVQNENNIFSAHHLMITLINFKRLKINKDRFIEILIGKGIYPQYHYIPIYRFSYYKKLKDGYKFKNSESYYESALSLPLYYNLSEENFIRITKEIKKIIKQHAI